MHPGGGGDKCLIKRNEETRLFSIDPDNQGIRLFTCHEDYIAYMYVIAYKFCL